MNSIKPKEAAAIINSLIGGVVPRIGIQYITVGRDAEINAVIDILREVKTGGSMIKFWIGDFGSGKSFMLHLLTTVSLKENFIVSNADFTPERRLYANDRKAVAMYTAIIDNLCIQTKQDGNALPIILEKWIEQVMLKTAEEYDLSSDKIHEEIHIEKVKKNILKVISQFTQSGGYDFGNVVGKYFEGYIKNDIYLQRNALRWLKADYTTKTDAKAELGVREIIDDQNYYNYIKIFCQFFVSIGYAGFVINLDEAVNLYKISQSQIREKNYEKILSIYNDCLQGNINNLFLNIAGNLEFLENERRGLFSYAALKTRLESNRYETSQIRDYSQPTIKLYPLSHSDIFVLLKKLYELFEVHFSCTIPFSDDEIKIFMEYIYNKPGVSEFLTPRDVITEFLSILSILRQNPSLDKKNLLKQIEVKKPYDPDKFENDIEEI